MKVLIVDDDEMQRFLLQETISDFGYEVEAACDGQDAWERIQSDQAPEIALVDWEMPVMDGVALCRAIKQRESGPYIYAIIVTSRTAKGDMVAGLDSGADDFLTKPVDPSELRSRLAVGARTVEYDAALRRQNAELERFAREMERLAREREIFSQAFHHSIQSMYITGPDAKILHVNPSCLRRYKYEVDEMKGRTPKLLNPGRQAYRDLGMPSAEYEALFDNLWKSIAAPDGGHWQGTLANRAKDGEIIWEHVHISAIRGALAETIGYICAPVDISDRVKKEFAIRVECYRAITDVAETRDCETGLHLKRMSDYSRRLAEEFGLPRKQIEDLAVFAPMHDIGKVGIPDRILLAPRKLTEAEFEIMKSHSVMGYEILRERATLEMAADIAYSHHERFDGKGYPLGLAGEDIPLFGRIVALADVYDALRSRRPYKNPWNHESARRLIVGELGTHFDPAVVNAFQIAEDDIEGIYEDNLENGAEMRE